MQTGTPYSVIRTASLSVSLVRLGPPAQAVIFLILSAEVDSALSGQWSRPEAREGGLGF